MASDDSSARIKNAASLLVRGGTLASDPCTKCGGVQVRYADKMTCINCGMESDTRPSQAQDNAVIPEPLTSVSGLPSVATMVEQKIAALASELRSEKDISSQQQMTNLLESYLRILEKIKGLVG